MGLKTSRFQEEAAIPPVQIVFILIEGGRDVRFGGSALSGPDGTKLTKNTVCFPYSRRKARQGRRTLKKQVSGKVLTLFDLVGYDVIKGCSSGLRREK
jgi:hypothetical protein